MASSTPPVSTEAPAFVSPDEAADLIDVSAKSIRRYVANGDLKAFRIRGSRLIKIRRDDVLALLEPIPTVDRAS